MKSKISKIIFFTLLPIICFAVIGFLGISSFVCEVASAVKYGMFIIAENSVFNLTEGVITGAQECAFSIRNGTLNMSGGVITGNQCGGISVTGESGNSYLYISGGEIYGNTTSIKTSTGYSAGHNISFNGTFIMTGGTIGNKIENDSKNVGLYFYGLQPQNIYGGTVYDNIYTATVINVKTTANIYGTITLGTSGCVILDNYDGTTPNYKINICSVWNGETIITFKGNSTEPDISKLTVTGYDTEKYELKTEKDSEGNWTIKLQEKVYTRVEEDGYSYVYFGSYPQSLKKDNISINENDVNNWGYYLGSDGERYAKKSDNFYKVEPIKWRICKEENGLAVIVSEAILDSLTSWTYINDEDNPSSYFMYETSYARAWLNGCYYKYTDHEEPAVFDDYKDKGFLQKAFTEQERLLIRTTLVDNQGYLYGKNYSGYFNNTEDKIWLLSGKELGHGASSLWNVERTTKSLTDYNAYCEYWMTRSAFYSSSAGDSGLRVGYVLAYHQEDNTGVGIRCNSSSYTKYGLLPALTISLDGTTSDEVVEWNFYGSYGAIASGIDNNSQDSNKSGENKNVLDGEISAITLFCPVSECMTGKDFSLNIFIRIANEYLFDEKRRNIFLKAKQLSAENVFFLKLKRADYFIF